MKRRDLLQGAILSSLPLLTGLNMAFGADESNSSPGLEELSGPSQGPWRRLFLDGAVVEQQQGLQRRFHQATKFDASPIIVADQPWEGKSAITGPYVYGTVLHEGDKFRLWYQILYQGNHVGYAESTDGVHWTKPKLDIVSFEKETPTNLVVSIFSPEKFSGVHCHNPSVIARPNDPDPTRRYALYGFDGGSRGPRVAFSADGFHFRYPPTDTEGNPSAALFDSSDVVSFFYDPYEARYCSTWKTRNRRGRAVGVAVSTDGLSWKKLLNGPVFVPDDHDADTTQVYGMPVFAYQGMYIGLPWIYAARYFRYGEYSVDKLHEAQADSTRTIEPQLAWSWDLVNWTRPVEREPIIARGQGGTWDAGMIVTARAPVIVEDELWFYYGGTDKVHDEPRAKAAIGLAKLRLDGFCSMSHSMKESDQAAEGWLITRREPMLGPSVLINARTGPTGSITAEILDRRNRVIPGFSRAECHSFSGDSVQHKLTWSTSKFSIAKTSTDYKLRFWLKDAELFSYLPLQLDPSQPDLARFPTAGP